MRIPSLIIDYSKLKDSDLTLKVKTIGTSLTDNLNFPETDPPVPQVTALREKFDGHLEKAINGDRPSIAIKNKTREELLLALRKLALFLDSKANGDHAILSGTGFDLVSVNDNVPALSVPENFKMIQGQNHGELKLSCKRVPQAISYLFEYTIEDPNSGKWTAQPSSVRECVIGGFNSGLKVYAKVIAVGTKGQQISSNVLSIVVQ